MYTDLNLIKKLTKNFDLTNREAKDIINCIKETIVYNVSSNIPVRLVGLGTFTTFLRHERGGVNPQNPTERIIIPAVQVAKFRVGNTLKMAVKNNAKR